MAKYNEENDYNEIEVIGSESVDVLDELQNKSLKKDDDTLDNVQDGTLFNKVPVPFDTNLETGKTLLVSPIGNKEVYNASPTILNADGAGGNPRLIEYDFSSLEFIYNEGDKFTLFLEEAGGTRLLDSNYTVQASDVDLVTLIDNFILAITDSHNNQHPSISPVPQPYTNRYTFTNTGKTLRVENLTTPDAITTVGSVQVNRVVENYWDAKPFLPDGDILFDLLPFYSGDFTEGVESTNYVVNADIPFDINLGPEQYNGKLIQIVINGVGAASYTVQSSDIRASLPATLVVLRTILKASIDSTLTPAGIDYLDTVIDPTSINRLKIRRSNTTPWVNNLASIDGYGQRGFVNVVDDLTTGGNTDALSATQGVVLNSTVSVVSGNLTSHLSNSSNPHSTLAFNLLDTPNDYSSIDFFDGNTFSSTPSAGTSNLAALTDQSPTTFASFVSDGTNYVLDIDTGVSTNIPRFAFVGFDGNNPVSVTVFASVNGTAYEELSSVVYASFPEDSPIPLDNINSNAYQYYRFEVQTQGSGDDVEIHTLGVYSDSKFNLSTTPGFYGYGFEPNSKKFFELLDVPQVVVEPDIFSGQTFTGGGITSPANMTDGDIGTSATFPTSAASGIPGLHVAADAVARRTLVINTTAADLDYITQTNTQENYKYTGESSPLGIATPQAASGSLPEITTVTITGAVVAGDLLRISSATEAADYIYVITGGEADTDAIATAFESQISGTSPINFTTSVLGSVITFTGTANNVDLNITRGTSREADFDSNRVFSKADVTAVLDDVLDGNIVEGDISNLGIGYGGVWNVAESANQPVVTVVNPAQAPSVETTTFDTPAGSSITAGDYFTFSSTTTDFYGYYEVDGSSGNDPSLVGRTGVVINITSSDDANTVAGTTSITLNGVSGVNSGSLSNTVTLTNDNVGDVEDFVDVSGIFTSVSITDGNSGQEVTEVTLFDNVADQDRYDITSSVEGASFRYSVPSDITISQVATGIANTINATATNITASANGAVVTLTVNAPNTADTVTSNVAREGDFAQFNIFTTVDLGEKKGITTAAVYVGGANSIGELILQSSLDNVSFSNFSGGSGNLSGWVRLQADSGVEDFNQYWRVFFKIPFIFADTEFSLNSVVANSNFPFLTPVTAGDSLTWNAFTAQKMSYIPTGTSLSAGNVQSALTELDTNQVTSAATLQGGIDTNTSLISINTTNIGVNAGNIGTNTTNIGTNTTNIGTNATNIGTNTTNIGINAGNIASNTSAIGTNTTNIGTNATNIGNNTSAIGTNTTNIGTNATNIGTNTTDISTLQSSKLDASEKAAANGVATLDATGVIPSSQIPPLAISETNVVVSIPGMLALDTQRGDFAIVTGENKTYVKLNDNVAPTVIGDWTELVPNAVASVNGNAGPIVTLTTSDIAEGTNEYYADAKVDGRIASASVNDLSDANISIVGGTAFHAVRVNGAGSGLDNTTFALPADNGTNGYVLTTDGTGGTAWLAASGGATVFTDLTDTPPDYDNPTPSDLIDNSKHTVSASSLSTTPPTVAIWATDNNGGTYWQSSTKSGNQWVKVDFGSEKIIVGTALEPRDSSGATVTDFRIEGSNNDSTWTDLTGTLTHGNNANLETFNFSNTTAYRYYRIFLISAITSFDYYSITEWQLIPSAARFVATVADTINGLTYRDPNELVTTTDIGAATQSDLLNHTGDTGNPHSTTFTLLGDTPGSFTGQSGNGLKVNVGETALEYESFATSTDLGNHTGNTGNPHSTVFTGLGDTPGAFTGASNQFVRVNSAVSALEFTSAVVAAISLKTANYTATTADHTILVNPTSSDATITLPAATTAQGLILVIKSLSNTYNVIIDGNASETIDGATTQTISVQYEALTIQCDGSNWHII